VELKNKKGTKRFAVTFLRVLVPRIVKEEGYSMDDVSEGQLLLMDETEESGAIGKVGNVLGGNDVNIVTMQVGRSIVGGSAIMMLTIDRTLTEDELTQVREVDGFDHVTAVDR